MAQWMTVDDYMICLGAPAATYTADDLINVRSAVNAVSAFITDARPDLTPPPPEQDEFGREIIANANLSDGEPSAMACRAACLVTVKWAQHRGDAQSSGYAEFGYIPSAIRGDADLQAMLKIAANSLPIAI